VRRGSQNRVSWRHVYQIGVDPDVFLCKEWSGVEQHRVSDASAAGQRAAAAAVYPCSQGMQAAASPAASALSRPLSLLPLRVPRAPSCPGCSYRRPLVCAASPLRGTASRPQLREAESEWAPSCDFSARGQDAAPPRRRVSAASCGGLVSRGMVRGAAAAARRSRASGGRGTVYSCFLGHFCTNRPESIVFVLALQWSRAGSHCVGRQCRSGRAQAHGGSARTAAVTAHQQGRHSTTARQSTRETHM
jgi:hypothetical protein